MSTTASADLKAKPIFPWAHGIYKPRGNRVYYCPDDLPKILHAVVASNLEAYKLAVALNERTRDMCREFEQKPNVAPETLRDEYCVLNEKITLKLDAYVAQARKAASNFDAMSVTVGVYTSSVNDTCPEQTEIVEVIRASDVSAAIAAGTLATSAIDPAQVGTGLPFANIQIAASTVAAGDYIRGKCFGAGADIYRKVIASSSTSCAAWRVVDGHLCSPCEAVWHNGRWQPASRVSSVVDTTVSRKIQLAVESDDYNESNYYLVSGTELLIHNTSPTARQNAC